MVGYESVQRQRNGGRWKKGFCR